jgi:hypothetical protein
LVAVKAFLARFSQSTKFGEFRPSIGGFRHLVWWKLKSIVTCLE